VVETETFQQENHMTLKLVSKTQFETTMSGNTDDGSALAKVRRLTPIKKWESILSNTYRLARTACVKEKQASSLERKANNIRRYSSLYKKTRTQIHRLSRSLEDITQIWQAVPPEQLAAFVASWSNGLPQLIRQLEAIDYRLERLLEGQAMGMHPRFRTETESSRVRWQGLIVPPELFPLKCNAAEVWLVRKLDLMLQKLQVKPTHRWKLIEGAFDSAFQLSWTKDRIRMHLSRKRQLKETVTSRTKR
jgi:hypothetical protein